MFLTMRAAHVLLAAIWFGAVTANVFFVIPAIQEAKGAGGQVMGILTRRGYITFLQAVSGIVTLTGFYLYYHLTQGFDPIVSGSMPARVFGAGGVAGFIASFVGPMFVGRNMKKIGQLMTKASPMADGPEKGALLAQVEGLRAQAGLWSKITLALMTIALLTMSVGHYIG